MTRKVVSQSQGFLDNRSALITTIMVLSIAMRALCVYLFSQTFLWDGIWSDAATYNQWARRIDANNDWVGGDPFFMTPLYPYFLAAVYSVLGPSLLAVRVIQAALGAGTAVLVFLVCERVFASRKAGFIAGVLAAVYGPFLLSHNLLLVETLKVFLLTLTLWLLLVAHQKQRMVWWFAGGVSLGFAILCRPSDFLVVGVVAAWILWFTGDSTRMKVLHLGIFVGAVLLVMAPVTIRNYVVSGEFILITSNGGLNFYLGNNPEAVGVFYNVDQLDLANDPDGRVYLESRLGKTLRPSDVSSIWFSKAADFIVNKPLDFLGLLGRKLLLFFHHKEMSQLGYNYAFVAQTSIPLFQYLPAFLLVGSFGLLGCVLALKKWKEFVILYGFLLAQVLGVVLFFVTDRFRLSAIPFLMIFAGYGIVGTYSLIKKRDKRRLFSAVAVLLASVLVITLLNYHIPDEFSLEWEYVGLMHFNVGNHAAALKAYQEAMRYKDSFHIRNNIGNTYLATGKMEEALRQYKIGQSLNPTQAISIFSMGTAFVSRQDWTSALQMFEKAIEINPRFAPAYLNKGLTLYYMQRFPEALKSLRSYVSLEKDKSKLASVYSDIRNLEILIRQRSSNPSPQ